MPVWLQVAAIAVVSISVIGFFASLFFFFNYLIKSIKTDVDIKKSASRLMFFYFAGIMIFNYLMEGPSLFIQYGRLIAMILLFVSLLAVYYFFYYFLYSIKNKIIIKQYAAILSVFFFLSLITSPIFLNYFEAYTFPKLKELKAMMEKRKEAT